jgi:NADH-quinone oxidoreductase subunit J
VHSVLFLILAFFNAAGLFLLMGAEFLAMMLIVVYVGAVAVLFLFVVMMLDVDFAELKQGFLQYLPIGALIGAVVLIELVLVVGAWTFARAEGRVAAPAIAGMSNTEALGRVLYTDYVYFFQAAGLVLLVAMIGAIVLTLHHRPNVKRQDMAAGRPHAGRGDGNPQSAVAAGRLRGALKWLSASPTILSSRRSCSRSACSASS